MNCRDSIDRRINRYDYIWMENNTNLKIIYESRRTEYTLVAYKDSARLGGGEAGGSLSGGIIVAR